ncbi:MAG: MFS transporter, partial [Microbacterium sp.]|uniref:MFS transporter n=1 Tax=Microbacterium sp. TaxID=51671 RepID=UPI001AC08795
MSVASEATGVRAYGQVLRLPGARTFVAAGILARFPRATLSLGVILLVSAATGSFGSAGIVVAPLVGGMAVAAPLWSSRMDRHGQARVILISLGCLVLAASALLALVLTAAPFWTWLIAAFATGAATPDLTSAVRARWTVLAPPSQRTAALALETIGDQMVFISGPPVITAVAAAVNPAVAMLGSLTLGVVGGVWLASQRRTQPPATGATGRARLVLPPAGVVPVALACVALGGVFGACDVTLVGWAVLGGRPWLAGPAF